MDIRLIQETIDGMRDLANRLNATLEAAVEVSHNARKIERELGAALEITRNLLVSCADDLEEAIKEESK